MLDSHANGSFAQVELVREHVVSLHASIMASYDDEGREDARRRPVQFAAVLVKRGIDLGMFREADSSSPEL